VLAVPHPAQLHERLRYTPDTHRQADTALEWAVTYTKQRAHFMRPACELPIGPTRRKQYPLLSWSIQASSAGLGG
jgi:hypothetical protein